MNDIVVFSSSLSLDEVQALVDELVYKRDAIDNVLYNGCMLSELKYVLHN